MKATRTTTLLRLTALSADNRGKFGGQKAPKKWIQSRFSILYNDSLTIANAFTPCSN